MKFTSALTVSPAARVPQLKLAKAITVGGHETLRHTSKPTV